MKDKKTILLFVLILAVCLIVSLFLYKQYQDNLKAEEQLRKEEQLQEIKNNYNNYVITIHESKIYDRNYKEIGTIAKDVVLKLEEQNLTADTEYFKILNLDEEYYISYKDVIACEAQDEDKRYLKYVPFDKQIITNGVTSFYSDNIKVYTINKSFNFPVYIIDGDKYYIEYDNRLMYILKDDIKEITDKKNSDAPKAKEIATILYHFIYNPDAGEVCDQVICHSMGQVQSHIDYLKQNNYFTPTMKEFEMWIDGKLNLPKNSLMITIDDGGFGWNAKQIFDKNEVNATLFMVGAWFQPEEFESKYLEIHSHGFDLHNPYVCPGGNQGGGILCLPKETLLEDLRKSREATNMTTAIAYPFYDYNNYSIEILKEAGFTMGFAGYYETGRPNMVIGGDKFRIPRFTFSNTTTTDYLASILSTYN